MGINREVVEKITDRLELLFLKFFMFYIPLGGFFLIASYDLWPSFPRLGVSSSEAKYKTLLSVVLLVGLLASLCFRASSSVKGDEGKSKTFYLCGEGSFFALLFYIIALSFSYSSERLSEFMHPIPGSYNLKIFLIFLLDLLDVSRVICFVNGSLFVVLVFRKLIVVLAPTILSKSWW